MPSGKHNNHKGGVKPSCECHRHDCRLCQNRNYKRRWKLKKKIGSGLQPDKLYNEYNH